MITFDSYNSIIDHSFIEKLKFFDTTVIDVFVVKNNVTITINKESWLIDIENEIFKNWPNTVKKEDIKYFFYLFSIDKILEKNIIERIIEIKQVWLDYLSYGIRENEYDYDEKKYNKDLSIKILKDRLRKQKIERLLFQI